MIRNTQPTRLAERRRRLFQFARHVKAMPTLADAPPAALRPYVRRWHELALPIIGTNHSTKRGSTSRRRWPT
jgi:hypothetical protein